MLLLLCRFNFEPGSNLILAGTIHFASSIQLAKQQLAADFSSLFVPQSKPLSPGQHAHPDRLRVSLAQGPLLSARNVELQVLCGHTSNDAMRPMMIIEFRVHCLQLHSYAILPTVRTPCAHFDSECHMLLGCIHHVSSIEVMIN